MAYWHTYVAQIHAVLGKLRDPTAIARIEFDQITSLMSYHVKVAGIRRKKRPSRSTKNMLRYFEQVLDTAHHKGILDVDFTGRTVGVTPRGHALYKDVLETIGGAYVDDKSNILANLKASQAIFGKYERRRKSEMAAALRRRDKIREVDIRHIRYRQGYDLDPIPEGDIDYNEPSTAVLNFLLPGEHGRRIPATPMKSKAKFPNGTPLTKAMSMSYNYCPTPESMPRYRTPIACAPPSPPSSPTPRL
ncbi:hypothetical protein C8J57DRAFT_575478 [Mycena rebaudengoi]|nr:hypothetical protein C8J57DRAFT_575478 [Mycena rebaudengoi]